MTTEQQTDTSNADTRTRILDATEMIMLEEGYAGVSSRKVAARAGLKSKLLHYYFANMDELFIAAFQRREHEYQERFATAAASQTPLHDLWAVGVHGASSALYLEFNALASHRPKVREFIARSNRQDRIAFSSVLEPVLQRLGIDIEKYPPKMVATAIAGFARVFATDNALGTDEGHSEVMEFIDRLMGDLEPRACLQADLNSDSN